MQDYLADNAETLKWLNRAAQLEHARYPADFREGVRPLMPWIRDVRACAQLYGVQMFLAIEVGDTSLFMDSFSGASSLVGSLSPIPAQVGQLSRMALTGLLKGALERALSCLHFSDEELIRLSTLLKAHQDVSHLNRGKNYDWPFAVDLSGRAR